MSTAEHIAEDRKVAEPITMRLAEFAAETTFESLPADVVLGSKRSILDTIGITLGGCTEPAPQILARYAKRQGGTPTATVIGQGFRTSAPLAALVNGTASDVFGFSDLSVPNMNHPSGSICSALFALAEETGASGRDIIAAHVIGVEIADKIGAGIKPGFQLKGWHPLAVLNTFGVAAACGKLLGFDALRMANALGVAGVMTSGIRAGMGTMSKALGAGRSARDGMEAALFVAEGYTGPTNVFEARDGFLQTFGDGASGEGILDQLGDPFEFTDPGMTYKAYPTCTRSHPGITAALRLREEHEIDLGAVNRVVCNVTPAVADYLKFGVATSKLEAKYSLPFCVALALTDGRVTLQNVTEERVQDPAIIALMKKVTMVVSQDFAQHGYLPAHAPHGCRIHIYMDDGRELVRQENRGPWEPMTPPDWDALYGKYEGCASLVLDPASVRESADFVCNLDGAADVSPLMQLIQGHEAGRTE